jgi:hypothetical protein
MRASTVGNWPADLYSLPYSTAFGVPNTFVGGTLKDAIFRTAQNSKAELVRQSVAALLNAGMPGFNFPITAAAVILKVQQSYLDPVKQAQAANYFASLNNAGNCPIRF